MFCAGLNSTAKGRAVFFNMINLALELGATLIGVRFCPNLLWEEIFFLELRNGPISLIQMGAAH